MEASTVQRLIDMPKAKPKTKYVYKPRNPNEVFRRAYDMRPSASNRLVLAEMKKLGKVIRERA